MSSDIPANWEAEAEAFLRDFAVAAGAALERTRLTEQLIAFELRPKTADAATVFLIVSPYEVIVEAGRGTRLELDPLPASRTELEEVLAAIADGRLNEQAGWFGLRFRLDLPAGRSLSGRYFGRRVPRGSVQYHPW